MAALVALLRVTDGGCLCVCVCVCVRGFRYIPLPKASARRHLIKHLLKDNPAEMSDADVDTVVKVTKGEAVPACRMQPANRPRC